MRRCCEFGRTVADFCRILEANAPVDGSSPDGIRLQVVMHRYMYDVLRVIVYYSSLIGKYVLRLGRRQVALEVVQCLCKVVPALWPAKWWSTSRPVCGWSKRDSRYKKKINEFRLDVSSLMSSSVINAFSRVNWRTSTIKRNNENLFGSAGRHSPDFVIRLHF